MSDDRQDGSSPGEMASSPPLARSDWQVYGEPAMLELGWALGAALSLLLTEGALAKRSDPQAGARALPAEGLQIHLHGALGAGKTTLVRGMLRGLGHVGPVKSPTFSVLEPYESERFELYHFDLYRLADGDELEMIGARDYFRNDAICVFEWPERAHGWLPAAALVIVIEPLSPGRAALEREPNDDDRSGPAPEGRWVELRAHHHCALALLDALDTLAPADARCLIPRGRA